MTYEIQRKGCFLETNKHTIKLYWEQIRKYKASFFTSLFCIPLAALALDTLLPYFLSQAIGGLSSQNHDAIIHNIFATSCVALIGVGLNLIGFQALLRHEANVRFELARDTFKRLIGKDLSFFASEKIGALTSRYIDFLRSHVMLQDIVIIRTLSFLISVCTGLVIVGWQSPFLALVLAALLAIIVIQVKFSIKYRKPFRFARKELMAESNGKVADALTNNLIVKTFAGEKTELAHLDQVNSDYRHAYIKDYRLTSFEGSTRLLVMSIIQIIAISICATLVSSGQMSIPIAVFMLIYLQRIASQLFTLGEMINGYDQALLEAAPMSEILAKDTIVNDKPNALTLHDITPTITLKDLSYHYGDSGEEVLQQINLSIAAGEKVGLVGNSGAGKTTITHLLLRFADVTGGAILIDGHDIRDVTQESLRRMIAYVPQEPMLFHRSLRENIIYGKPDATDKEVRRAAEQANALEFIDKLPHGLDTIVGERGVKLSGGQRQRVAIARAILKDAPILVLDEATSALDSESEKLIQNSLEKLMKGRTSIVIAHRLSTIATLDRIIVIGDGKIIEDGSHAELLAANETYARLWKHQSGGFIEG
jgi:ATP-binding cassette subfamily B protein